MDDIDDNELLIALAQEIIARNFILETVLVGTWRALIEKGIVKARELDEEIDIISMHYPSHIEDDPGVRFLKELKEGINSPFAKYVEKVFPIGEACNDPVI